MRIKNEPALNLPGTILAEGLTVGTDMYETQLNNNVAVFGTPGGGKTQGFVKPNIMQMNSNYVVTDPKGNLCDELRPMLEAAGYKVLRLDLVNPLRSNGYNPFRYLRNDKDIDFFVEAIISSGGRFLRDPFWDDTTAVLLKAIIGLCRAERKMQGVSEDLTMREVIDALDMAFIGSSGRYPGSKNALDDRFEVLVTGVKWQDGKPVQIHEGCHGEEYRTWKRFKQLAPADTTMACVYMEAAGKLTHLTNAGVLSILDAESDPIFFWEMGYCKIALFVVVSDTDRSLDFLTSIFYTQLFKELCRIADNDVPGGDHRLPIPMRVILDDFANQAPIPDFDSLIAAVRSRDIWINVICQANAQLEARYEAAAQTIIGCCDTVMYLGVNDMKTARELSERSDLPVSEIQSLPIGETMIFRRGSACQVLPRYNLESHCNKAWLASEIRKRKAAEREKGATGAKGFPGRKNAHPRKAAGERTSQPKAKKEAVQGAGRSETGVGPDGKAGSSTAGRITTERIVFPAEGELPRSQEGDSSGEAA